MPYTTTNNQKFVMLRRARFYSVDVLVTFYEKVFEVKFRFEAERVEAHDAISAFVKGGRKGSELFGYDLQFPDTENDYYIPLTNADLRVILEDLTFVCTSIRSENAGKDVASTKSEEASTKQIREQKAQDENKAWQAAVRRLSKLAFDYEKYISREQFEAKDFLGLTWT